MLWAPSTTSCSYCGRSCNCTVGNIFTVASVNYTLPKTAAELEWEGLEEDVQRALQKKWEIRLRFLESIRGANQPRRLRPTSPVLRLSGPRLAVRATRFRRVASSRPGYRGTTDGKRT